LYRKQVNIVKTLDESIRNTEGLIRRLRELPPPQGGKWQKAMIVHYEEVLAELREIKKRDISLTKRLARNK
jgi:hypothetical protein